MAHFWETITKFDKKTGVPDFSSQNRSLTNKFYT